MYVHVRVYACYMYMYVQLKLHIFSVTCVYILMRVCEFIISDSPVSVSPLSPVPEFTTQSLDNLTDAGSPTNNNKFRYSSVDILNTVYE